MHDPAEAKGSETAMSRTDMESCLLLSMVSPRKSDSRNAPSPKHNDRHREKVREYLITVQKFSCPAPLASETNLPVEVRIFPFASTIINPNSENISDISPTAEVPAISESFTLNIMPAVCIARLRSVIFAASFAICFSEIILTFISIRPSFGQDMIIYI